MKRFQRLLSIILVLSILIAPISELFNISIVNAESGTSIEEIVDIVSTEEETSDEDTSYENNDLEIVDAIEEVENTEELEEDVVDQNHEDFVPEHMEESPSEELQSYNLMSIGNPIGSVYVTLENTTYPISEGAPWEGVLLDQYEVSIYSGYKMMDAIAVAFEVNNIEAIGMENNYISSIDGLAEFDGGFMSGWMGTLNDWFTNVGFKEVDIEDGDIINIMYTTSYGNDLGGSWGNTETTLKSLEFNTGELSQEFRSDTKEYTLTVSEDTEGVIVTPTATNKNYQVRTYLDNYSPNDTGYKRTDSIPVIDGSKIIIGVGDPLWPGMNDSGDASQYTITVEFEKPEVIVTPKEQLEKNLAYILRTVDNPTFGTGGGEWSVLSLARGEYAVPKGYYDIYYNNVVKEVKELMPKYGGKLHRNKGTEHSRLILGLTAIGKDIGDVGGYDISEALADYNYVIRQGINGPIFALIALDTHNYEMPILEGVAVQSTREMFIDFILNKEIAGGGWALSGTTPDPDITAMAIQSLTPYYSKDNNVKAAVDRGIDWLSNAQKEEGGYASWGSVNSESIAQVVVALTGLGIDPHTDARFIKNGNSAIDALMTFAVADGGFMHIKPGATGNGGAAAGAVDGMATDQGTYALVAYDRFINKKSSLYDMTDVELETPDIEAPIISVEGLTNNQTVTEKGLTFKVSVTDNKDSNISPIVKLNGEVITGTDGSYYVTLTDGENIITIEATDAAGNKKDITYKLIYEATIKVESIFLNKSKVELLEGENLELNATITPNNATNKNFTWKSNNEEVAKVDNNGKVTAIKEGVSTITVTTQDGNKTANCTVTVNKKDIETSVLLIKDQIQKNLAYILKTVDNPTFGTGGGEWSVLSLARGEYAVPKGYYDIYYNNVVKEVKELMPKYGGKLHRNKGTEHSRLILGLTAIGKDIGDVGGYDISEALVDYNYVIRQGINGPIFALIALDTHNYEMPILEGVAVQSTREMFIDFILNKEIAGGGWALSGTTPDPDITAMAIQSLTPYYSKDNNVKAAVDRGIDWLSNAQKEEGGYASWGSVNSESIAQVVVALTGLGIDPHTDARFIKNGNSAIDALMTFAVADGGFMHIKPGATGNGGAAAGAVDGMATDQGTYALVAYDRFINKKSSLYDMTDVELKTPDIETPEEPGSGDIEVPASGEIEVPVNNIDNRIPLKTDDVNKEIKINIPSTKTSKVSVNVSSISEFPKLEVNKGNITLLIDKGTQIKSSDVSDIEMITSKSSSDTSIRNKLNNVIPRDKKLDTVNSVFSMGGEKTIEFDNFVTLTFKGMKGKDAAYIQGGKIICNQKYSSDAAGSTSGNTEYAYDSGQDLIVKTKHFTDFIAYTTSKVENPTPTPDPTPTPPPTLSKSYITLSIDKKTINKGYVLSPTKVEITEGESVWDVLKREMDRRNIEYDYVYTEKYNSVYVEWIAGDGEFDHGSGSGWMYNVNGWYPNYGASVYKLSDEDVVEWRYTTDLGADLGEDITKWDRPTITVRGIKDNEKVKEREITFKVTAKSANGKSITPTVQLNGKTVRGVNDTYEVILEEGKNEITIIALDSEGNRADETYTLIYIGSSTETPSKPKKPMDIDEKTNSNSADVNGNLGSNNAVLNSIFSDSSNISSWAIEHVKKATELGFVQGSNGKFNPKSNITRAEFTKIITSILGINTSIEKNINFTDVSEKDWFYSYVNAAFNAGIIQGDGSNFNPNNPITREQMASIIVRALNIKHIKSGTIIQDIDKVSDWARKDVETVVALGLIIGDNGKFDPKSNATREMATVVAMRGYEYKDQNKIEDNKKKDVHNLDVKNQIKETAKFMQNIITDPIVASVGGEWTVFGLARSGENVPESYYDRYYANVNKTLKEKKGKLHHIKYTEYDRVILALTSIGKDIKDVSGYDLTKPLADFNTLIKQGINGPIFALIALDSNNYEIPIDSEVKVQTTRQLLIDFILGREIAGGGWALGEKPSEADPDITAMAIQAFAPYYESELKVKEAVNRGLEWLSRNQKSDGGYSSWGSINSESIAQVVVALTSLGIDPHNDSRFIKNGVSVIDALLSFSAPGGGFYHVKLGDKGNGGANPGDVDPMATDQAMYAIVAYDRFINGQNRLYDMTDVK